MSYEGFEWRVRDLRQLLPLIWQVEVAVPSSALQLFLELLLTGPPVLGWSEHR